MAIEKFVPQFRPLHQPTEPAKADVFWLTHAGGGINALAYRARSIDIDPSIWLSTPVMPAREELFELQFEGDLNEIARAMSDQIVAIRRNDGRAKVPLVLIGHSFGSVLAYRTVCQLIASGTAIHRLVVLSFPAADRMTYDKQLHRLDNQQLIQEVDQMFGGVPENLLQDESALEFFVPALRFDLGLLERYRHEAIGEQIDVPITAICGTDDHAVDLADMQRWKKMTRSDFRLRSMPGDHFFPSERMAEVLTIATWGASVREQA